MRCRRGRCAPFPPAPGPASKSASSGTEKFLSLFPCRLPNNPAVPCPPAGSSPWALPRFCFPSPLSGSLGPQGPRPADQVSFGKRCSEARRGLFLGSGGPSASGHPFLFVQVVELRKRSEFKINCGVKIVPHLGQGNSAVLRWSSLRGFWHKQGMCKLLKRSDHWPGR